MKKVWVGILLLSGFSLAWAWNIDIQKHDEQRQIWLSNARAQSEVDVYIAWFDKDADTLADMFLSWNGPKQWRPGLRPILREVDLDPLDDFYLDDLPRDCPKEHRCFLALVAVPAGAEATALEQWQEAALMPLNELAAQDRMPGQSVFFTPEETALYADRVYAMDDGAVALDEAVPSTAPATTAPTEPDASKSNSGAETEKPDVFRREGNRILYANGQAERLQVIDITDPADPRLAAETRLEHTPKELYQLNDFVILMQTGDYQGEQGTLVSVFQPDGNALKPVSEITLPGTFLESRRRDQMIYTVGRHYRQDEQSRYQLELKVNGLMLDAFGHASTVEQVAVPGYDPKVAIFPDHLVIANRNPDTWRESLVQVFDLSDPAKPLRELNTLKVPGYIPSEFHLSVQNQQLRLVYGPEDRSTGSTLAIYDLADETLPLVGQVSDIAPGESLFATRFVDDLAYVVTYQRTDPLWVISLKNPAKPEILGELEIPGWSEKLFFHDDQLFAVGIHDQPLENEDERWVRRVAVSLFDVSNPLKPAILDRFVPLADQTRWSTSPALDDERALLLDWGERYAALPLESWETEAGSHLQIVTFDATKFSDGGRVDIGVPVLRSLELDTGLLGVLGDQSYLSVQWGESGDTQVLGQVELAANLTWVKHNGDALWAAGYGNNGLHRLYRVDTSTPPKRGKALNLPRGYQYLALNDQWAVFHNTNPLAVQLVDLDSGTLYPAQTLEEESEEDDANTKTTWSERSRVFLSRDQILLAERKVTYEMGTVVADQSLVAVPRIPELLPSQPMWTLRAWTVGKDGKATRETRYSLPGNLVAVLDDGRLLTREWGEKGLTRINLVGLREEKAQLFNSVELPCHYYQSGLHWDGASLLVTCPPETYYYPMLETEGEEPVEPRENTLVWRLQAKRWLNVVAEQTLPGYRSIVQASPDWAIAREGLGGYWGLPYYDDVVFRRSSPYYGGGITCEVFDAHTWESAGKLEQCPYASDALALSGNQAWIAQGFEGIRRETW